VFIGLSAKSTLKYRTICGNHSNKASLHIKIFLTLFSLGNPPLPSHKLQTFHQIRNQSRRHQRTLISRVQRSDGKAVGFGLSGGLDGREMLAIGEDVGGLWVVESVVGIVDGAAVWDGGNVGHVAERSTGVFDEIVDGL
jgi:hypothetical protein